MTHITKRRHTEGDFNAHLHSKALDRVTVKALFAQCVLGALGLLGLGKV